ncbi:MAG: hypothetical protein ACYCQI_06455 [Gammaproteobacteria bacterium]
MDTRFKYKYRMSGGLQGLATPMSMIPKYYDFPVPAGWQPINGPEANDLELILQNHPFYFIQSGYRPKEFYINTGNKKVYLEWDPYTKTVSTGYTRYANLSDLCKEFKEFGLQDYQMVKIAKFKEKDSPWKSLPGYIDYDDKDCDGVPFEMNPYQYCICKGPYEGWLEIVCTYNNVKEQFPFCIIPLVDGRFLMATDRGIVFPSINKIVELTSQLCREYYGHTLEPYSARPTATISESKTPIITLEDKHPAITISDIAPPSPPPPETQPPGGPSFFSAAAMTEEKAEDPSIKLMKLAKAMPEIYINAPRGFQLFNKFPHKEEIQRLITQLNQCKSDEKSNSKFEHQMGYLLSAYKYKIEKLGAKYKDKLNDHPNKHHYTRMLAVLLQQMQEQFPKNMNAAFTREVRELANGVTPQPYFASEAKASKRI